MTAEPIRFFLDYDRSQMPDWEAASKVLRPGRGVVVVEALLAPEKIGSLYLPDEVRTTRVDREDPLPGFEPSLGVVLASDAPEVPPGTMVGLVDGDGLCLDAVEFGSYKAKGEVRVYGRVVPDVDLGVIEEMPWHESVVFTVDTMDEQTKRPTGLNYFIRRENPLDRTESGLLLPEGAQTAPCTGQIIARGSFASQYEVGQRVVYHPLAMIDLPGEADVRIAHEDAILIAVDA